MLTRLRFRVLPRFPRQGSGAIPFSPVKSAHLGLKGYPGGQAGSLLIRRGIRGIRQHQCLNWSLVELKV